MNILVEQLPDAVEIGGREYPVNTDFRACLRVILAFEDHELTGIEKQAVLLENLYPVRPHDVGEAVKVGVRFLNGGEAQQGGAGEGGAGDGEVEEPGPRLYSFGKDANLIFAAFRQTHGIDLASAELHWWQFLALFMDLGAETAFCNLVSLRKRVKSGRASAEEQRAYRELGSLAELEEPEEQLTPDEREREAEFLRLVAEGEHFRAEKERERAEAAKDQAKI